jgi:ABC-type antimicrobial peptide transport system permease subunit
VIQPKTLETQVNESLSIERLLAMLSTFFASLAALLAAVGLFGVLSYSVARHEREIGIRIAIGARPWQAAWGVVRQVAVFAVAGLAAGLAVAAPLSAKIETLLFGVKPGDPVALVSAAGVMLGLAVAAAFLPARRAASVEPAVAFRAE